jgi:hypothetical protein
MMHGGTISNGWTGNRDPARRRRYPLNLHGVASMPIEWAAIPMVAISDAILLDLMIAGPAGGPSSDMQWYEG